MKSEFNRKFEQVPWARFVLSLLDPDYGRFPVLFGPMLKFVDDLISSSPEISLYSSGKAEIDGVDTRFVASRDSNGITWMEEGEWVDGGDYTHLPSKLKYQLKRNWNADRAYLAVTASGKVEKSSLLKTWAWEGATSAVIHGWAPEIASKIGEESIKWWREKHCYFPLSKETISWKQSNADQLLERLAAELSRLSSRIVTVHPHWYSEYKSILALDPEIEVSRSSKLEDDVAPNRFDSLTVWRSEVTARARSFYEEIDLVFPPPLKVAFFSPAEIEESRQIAEHFRSRLTAAFARDLEEGAIRACEYFVAEQYEPISNRLGDLGYDSPDRF